MISMPKGLREDEPVNYYFFEEQGERAVDPTTVINCGTELWMQAADNFAVVGLWEYAATLFKSAPEEHGFSLVEYLRLEVIQGHIVPPDWRDGASFPFKGLLLSAIYFQEARKALAGPKPDRAWHLVSTAYYHLGLNTIESALMTQSRIREQKNSTVTVEIRALVGYALDWVIKNHAPVSLSRAKELVREWLDPGMNGNEITDLLLLYADKSGIAATLPAEVRCETALDQIDSLLDLWARSNGPYPEITRKFAAARSKEAPPPEEKSTTAILERPEGELIESEILKLQIVSVRSDDYVLTARWTTAV